MCVRKHTHIHTIFEWHICMLSLSLSLFFLAVVVLLLFLPSSYYFLKNFHRYWFWSPSPPSLSLIICEQCFPRNVPNDTPKKRKQKKTQTQIRLIILLFAMFVPFALFIIIERPFFTIKRCLCFTFVSVVCITAASAAVFSFSIYRLTNVYTYAYIRE